MKPRLFSSLALNVILGIAGVAFWLCSRLAPEASGDLANSAAPASSLHTSETAAPAYSPASPASPFPWRRIESEDYPQYMANLRATGCPEWLIRDIIVADIDGLYAGQFTASITPVPAWANGDRHRTNSLQQMIQCAAVGEEKRALIRQLLGYEWNHRSGDVWSRTPERELVYGFLPDEKAGELVSLMDRVSLQTTAIRESANQILIAEDRARLQQLQQQMDLEAARFLTPVELEEYKLRTQTVDYLLASEFNFKGVTVSGSELREMARLSRLLQDSKAESVFSQKPPSDEERERRNSRFEQQVKTLLGSDRFGAYLRAKDPRFGIAFDFTEKHNLPRSAAVSLHDAQRLADEQAGQIRDDASLSAEEQGAALQVLKATTQQKISSALGGAYSNYFEENGDWLENLVDWPPSEGSLK